MSNSIWKTPDQKPVNDNDILIISDKACFVGHFDEFHDFFINHSSGSIYGPEDIDYWATLEDLVNQANKAERLQKAVNTALISIGTAAIFDGEDAKKYANAKIDLIKQLIKGE